MSEQDKAVVRRYFAEVWSKGNYDVADEVIARGVPATTGMAMSPEMIKRVVPLMRAAFPDITYKVDQIIAEGDRIVAYWTASGTHKGEFRGVAPTGKQIKFSGFDIYRMSDGKLAERWGLNDDLGLLQQLGAVSVPPLVI